MSKYLDKYELRKKVNIARAILSEIESMLGESVGCQNQLFKDAVSIDVALYMLAYKVDASEDLYDEDRNV